MFNVMLVDDDYPVLDFLSEVVDWDTLGLHLQSVHKNGTSALEYALTDMPDILVTDIGMPKMNGLELTEKLKKKNPQLQVAILSCHNEFEYAQQAISLNVQDYILKETLDPKDFSELLLTYKKRLETEERKLRQQSRLMNDLKRNTELVRDKYFKQMIYQSNTKQARFYGDDQSEFILDSIPYIPVLCLVDNYISMKNYFNTEDTLRFAIQNVIDDVISECNLTFPHFYFERNEFFLLLPNRLPLNAQVIKQIIKHIQNTLSNYLNISTSYIIGKSVDPENLSIGLKNLSSNVEQHFYRDVFSIDHYVESNFTLQSQEDIFTYYEKIKKDFRHVIFNEDNIELIVKKWMNFIQTKVFPPRTVKEFILKLLLGLKVNMKSLYYFQSTYSLEILHHEILLIDSLEELKLWLIKNINSMKSIVRTARFKSRHKEILNACIYISMNIESKLSLEEVANHVYLNTSYFSRLFKSEIGITFIEYVTSLKMDRAKELLDQTTLSVSEISEILGYDNQSYFIKLFKNCVGKTPTKYRG